VRVARLRGLAAGLIAVLAGCAAGGGAAHKPAEERATSTPSDSATVVLWHFDETGSVRVPDAGPIQKDGVAGPETHSDFGRINGARTFTQNIQSFVWSPWQPEIETPAAITIEAWLRLASVGSYEDTPIACRWTPRANEQSWVFSVAGRNLDPPFVAVATPGYHKSLVAGTVTAAVFGHLMFGYQPRDADSPRSYFSSQAIEIGRWTHVAVTFDGHAVRFFINGVMDSQYAVSGAIRASSAPLMVGNGFDPRWLSYYGEDLRMDPSMDPNPYYALDGSLDELRISNIARTDFPYAR
jgi:hypothetical protein